jgi:hypothetical protein
MTSRGRLAVCRPGSVKGLRVMLHERHIALHLHVLTVGETHRAVEVLNGKP